MNAPGRIVIVGASLAGLRAAEALRDAGFAGHLALVGEEPHEPYDRPPLSKQVAIGLCPAESTTLPRLRDIGAEWHLGVAATRLNRSPHAVTLSTGAELPYDRLLVATGVRARPWPNAGEAALAGVLTLRTREDAARLRLAFSRRPRRVVVIGGGFTGCEIAAACVALGLPVTLVERNEAPLARALGTVVGEVLAAQQRDAGVDLRCGTAVRRLEGDAAGRVRAVQIQGAASIAADLVVVALGSLANVEWLAGADLASDPGGLTCDAECRALDVAGEAADDIFAVGDVARVRHPLFGGSPLTMEHWGSAVEQARSAAHNMLASAGAPRSHRAVPAFWSSQFGLSIKAVGMPSLADEVALVQGSFDSRCFLAHYGRQGRLVGAVAFDHGRWLPGCIPLIEASAPFPGPAGMDAPARIAPLPAGVPSPRRPLDPTPGCPAGRVAIVPPPVKQEIRP